MKNTKEKDGIMKGTIINTTEDRVKKVIAERLTKDIKRISLDTSLLGKGLGLDSIGILELVVGLEQEFDISFDDTELNIELFENIGSLVKHIDKKLHQSEA